jgi:hypothetical protein
VIRYVRCILDTFSILAMRIFLQELMVVVVTILAIHAGLQATARSFCTCFSYWISKGGEEGECGQLD